MNGRDLSSTLIRSTQKSATMEVFDKGSRKAVCISLIYMPFARCSILHRLLALQSRLYSSCWTYKAIEKVPYGLSGFVEVDDYQ
jgi:hypothetical protein